MTAERYIETNRQLNIKLDEDKIPPSIYDFPSYVLTACGIFNVLPDVYSGGMEPVFCNKDLSALPIMFEIFDVDKEDYVYILDVIQVLTVNARNKAIADAKKRNKNSTPTKKGPGK